MMMNVKFCFGGNLGIWNSGRLIHAVTRALTTINKCNIGLIMYKYRNPSINTSVNITKQHIWMQIVEVSVARGKIVFC